MDDSIDGKSGKRLSVILIGLAIWWLAPLVAASLPSEGEQLIPVIFIASLVTAVVIAVCFQSRKSDLVFLFWFPVAAFSVCFFLKIASAFFGELAVGGMGGGGAPLGGVAMMIGLAALLVAFLLVVASMVAFPRRHSLSIVWLTIFNTGAVASTVWFQNGAISLEPVSVQILDSAGKPISGVEVRYKVYGYGPGGMRPSSPERTGGPALSDANGKVVLRSKKMLHEMDAFFSKPGYESLRVNLGMQYNKYWNQRDVRIWRHYLNENSPPTARGFIPSAEPVHFTVYLTNQRAEQSLQQYHFEHAINREPPSDRYFKFETGKFSTDPQSDLRFDIFQDKAANGVKCDFLRITGINGVELLQLPPDVQLTEPLSSFEQVMKWAPENGYQSAIVVKMNAFPAPTVYIRGRIAKLYARLTFLDCSAYPLNPITEGIMNASIEISTNGSRDLDSLVKFK